MPNEQSIPTPRTDSLRNRPHNFDECFELLEQLERELAEAQQKITTLASAGATLTKYLEKAQAELAALREDKARLDWLLDFITGHGLKGMEHIAWSIYGEGGESLMHRETVSEDEIEDMRFDRAAIDAAMWEGKS